MLGKHCFEINYHCLPVHTLAYLLLTGGKMGYRYPVCERVTAWEKYWVNLGNVDTISFTCDWINIHLHSISELSLIEKASHQIFEFSRKREPFSDSTLDLLCQSASYVLHVVAKFDEVTAKETDSAWQLDRSELFDQMKVSLSEWIARQDVIGGSSFGGNIPKYDSRTLRRNKGEGELAVCQTFLGFFFHNNDTNMLLLYFSTGMHYFWLMVQQVMTGKT